MKAGRISGQEEGTGKGLKIREIPDGMRYRREEKNGTQKNATNNVI